MVEGKDKVLNLEEDIRIVGAGYKNWAVLSMRGRFRFEDNQICIIYSDLKSREAAEIVRRQVIEAMSDKAVHSGIWASPFVLSSNSLSEINRLGTILAELRTSGVTSRDDIALAKRLLKASEPYDHEIPF